MKKYVILLLAAVLALTFVACNQTNAEDNVSNISSDSGTSTPSDNTQDVDVMIRKAVQQAIDAYADGTIDDDFGVEEYQEIPKGIIFPDSITGEENVEASSIIDLGNNDYLVEIPCKIEDDKTIFMYVEISYNNPDEESYSRSIKKIYFSQERIEYEAVE